MKMTDEEKFLNQVKAHLDASIRGLDPELLTRLEDMRRQALAVAVETELSGQQAIRIRGELDDELALDPAITRRLDQIREQALLRMPQPKAANATATTWLGTVTGWLESYRLAIPASVFATACLVVTVVSLTYSGPRQPGSISVDDEILLIASADDIELYENLEFYLWLAENGLPN